MSKKEVRVYPIYVYYGRDYIKKNGYGWMIYRYYSSKTAAHKGLMHIMRTFGKKTHSERPMCVVKTKKGWGVFQLPQRGSRTKSIEIKKHIDQQKSRKPSKEWIEHHINYLKDKIADYEHYGLPSETKQLPGLKKDLKYYQELYKNK